MAPKIKSKPTERRASLRSGDKVAEAAAAAAAKPAKKTGAKKTPTKKAAAKASAQPKAAASGTKRKSPSPEEAEDFEGATAVEDEESDESPKKKAKTSIPKKAAAKASPKKSKGKKSEKEIKKEDEDEEEDEHIPSDDARESLVPIDPDFFRRITEAMAAHTSTTPPLADQISQGLRTALTPYLDILDPFMQFQMLCNGRNADTPLGMQVVEKMTEVLDVVQRLKGGVPGEMGGLGDESEDGEEYEDFEGLS